jgi:hypothetical protein
VESTERTVTLDLDARDREFLRGHIGAVAGALRENLAEPGCLSDPEAAARELAAYEALVAGLGAGTIDADAEVQRWAAELGRRGDRENEWERAAREHLAFGALVGALDPGAGR